jgi:aspartyl protease family protein
MAPTDSRRCVGTMVKVIGIVAVVAVICVLKLQTIEGFALGLRPAPAAVASNASPPPRQENNYGSRTVTLQSDGRGHFQVQARVDGRWIDFLVDTGASLIALRESSAAKLGVHPSARDYSVKMQTANGVGKAARIQLNSVEVNGITVRDVEAFVIPDEQLSTNLLGMSFLSRVKFSHDRGRLVLEQ